MSTKPDVETAWTKPSSIRCFDDWFRREDFGDRDQLERCWANAQNVAARDRRDTSPSDFEHLLRLRAIALKALTWMDWWKDPTVSAYPDGLPPMSEIITALREALAQYNEEGARS